MYSKCTKISNILFRTFLAKILLFIQLIIKINSGMANSVDPDQTLLQEQSDLGLHCLLIPFC